MIQTIESFDQLAEARRQWDELLQSAAAPTVFLSHEWLSTWWKHLGGRRKLKIAVVADGDRWLGVLPVALRPSQPTRMTPRVLEFLGSGVIGSDYLDVIVRRGSEKRVLTECEDYLNREGHILQLTQLRRGVSLAERLAGNLSSQGWGAVDALVNVCPYIDFSEQGWEGYYATLSSSQRYNFQRRTKNLAKLPGFRMECVTDSANAVRSLEVLIDLHNKRWHDRDGSSEAFQTPAVREFHRHFVELAAERGWLRLFIMWVDDRAVAALYGLRYGNVFSFYQSGFDPEFSKQSVGLVMMGKAIQSAVNEGCAEYDFLHGSEEYKFHWTRATREIGRVELFPPRTQARLFRHAIGLNRNARRMVKRVLQRNVRLRVDTMVGGNDSTL